jgi:hypothetical protein
VISPGVARALAPVALVLAVNGASLAQPRLAPGAAPQPRLPPGAAVETEGKARELAFRAYVEKMKLRILAEEGITHAGLLTIGYDIPGFARRRDPVWEVRIETLSVETRALIWVHAHSGRVLFVIGPWEREP